MVLTASVFLAPPACIIQSIMGLWEPVGEHNAESKKETLPKKEVGGEK